MKVFAVIGANFGDEGKGAITDFLADDKSCVVRFNGGAQAGHTVVAPDGRRHVFHHLGAGTLRGASTFLSRFFIVNPIIFAKEWNILSDKSCEPDVTIDPDALVTTPIDMILNQAIERKRGDRRHGSCGVGINETVERGLKAEFRIVFKDLADKPSLGDKILRIMKEYAPMRAAELGVELPDFYNQPAIWLQWTNACEFMIKKTWVRNFNELLSSFRVTDKIIFEGAQGLGLDQAWGNFPHVTRSNTGSHNVLQLCEEAGLKDLEIFYTTRTYFTRHGDDPSFICIGKPYDRIVDETNVKNDHQGEIRYSWFDLPEFTKRVIVDESTRAGYKVNATTCLAITCIDQLPADMRVKYFDGSLLTSRNAMDFIVDIERSINSKRTIVGCGPTRDTTAWL